MTVCYLHCFRHYYMIIIIIKWSVAYYDAALDVREFT